MAQNVTTSSKRFSLNLNDFWKGLLVAVGGAVFQLIWDVINSGSLDFDWAAIGRTALLAALAYLGKNFFDKPKVVITGVSNETIDKVNDGAATAKIV